MGDGVLVKSYYLRAESWIRSLVVMFFAGGHQISHLLQSILGLRSLNHGKSRTIGCLGLQIMLKETTHPKSPKSMFIGSDSSNISLKAMGRPSTTTMETGQGSVCKDI